MNFQGKLLWPSTVKGVMHSVTPVGERSRQLYTRAARVMPGGDTRSVTFFPPYPAFFTSGQGSTIKDVDGREYIDFLNNYTSLILGHTPPEIIETVKTQITRGSVFPSPLEAQIELAEMLVARIPSCEKIRFCNSGTEANIQAFRAARKYTGRKKVLKISGGYHGSFDLDNIIEIPFNDCEAAETTIKNARNELSCVITEPILGKGMIPASKEFLATIRELTHRYDIIFILDEVVTFRLAEGGVQAVYDIYPDMTTLGKIIGGGFPVGAFGGKEELMMQFSHSHRDHIPHSGTFNGNPVTMVAGRETLKIYDNPAIEALNTRGEELKRDLNALMEHRALSVEGMGSLLHFHFAQAPARNFQELDTQSKTVQSLLHLAMMAEGIVMAPRGMFNLSMAHAPADITAFTTASEHAISQINTKK
jgi:glutamate-1-semialdehyde 2,1-aminomutase